MLFDETTANIDEFAAVNTRPEDEIGTGLAFDWEENRFLMEAGSPVMVSGIKAIEEWMNLAVRTRQNRYPIYPVDFGGDAMDIIGKKLPKGFQLSEFKRRMEETAAYNPGISDLDEFVFDGEKIRIKAILSGSMREVLEIEL